MTHYDSIIIGAGHNGLVCAAYLARAGQRVLIVEAGAVVGGLGARREFYPGFETTVAHSVCHFPDRIARELELEAHGYAPGAGPMPTIGLDPDGQHVIADGDTLVGASAEDAAAWRDYLRDMQCFADALEPFWLKTMPRIGANSFGELLTFGHLGLNIRRLGRETMQELLRVITLPARDLMDERFCGDLVKTLASWDGLIGSRLAPRSPNGAVLAMLYRLAGSSNGAHRIPPGGIGGLIDALSASAVAAGAAIKTGTAVDRVIIEGDTQGQSVRGVKLSDGEEIRADRVVSSADPQTTFLQLVGVEHLEIEFANRIRRLRCDGLVAKLHLALDGPPEFEGVDRSDGRMIIAPSLDAVEFAFDAAKYGECPEAPVMEIVVPSLRERGLAPEGRHLISAHVMYVPCRLKGGWSEDARDTMRELSIGILARYAPRLREQIIHSEFLTPADLAHEYRVTGGHWHHAELVIDQMLMMRPTYEAAQYATPLPGLFLCGAGCHPGGDLTGAPGHNAAREILR